MFRFVTFTAVGLFSPETPLPAAQCLAERPALVFGGASVSTPHILEIHPHRLRHLPLDLPARRLVVDLEILAFPARQLSVIQRVGIARKQTLPWHCLITASNSRWSSSVISCW